MSELLNIFTQAGSLQVALVRMAAFTAGTMVLLHFACMSFRVIGHTAYVLDAVLIAALAASGLAVMLDAVFFDLLQLVTMLAVMSGGLIVFLLRFWAKGFHVSTFLKGKHTCG